MAKGKPAPPTPAPAETKIDPDRWYSAEEAAGFLKLLSTVKLWQKALRRTGIPMKMVTSRTKLYKGADLLDYLEGRPSRPRRVS